MEKEEQKLGQAEVEEEEASESTPLVRKSRNEDDIKIFATSAVDNEVSIDNGVSPNGHTIQSRIAVNEAENEELIIPAAEEQEVEEIDWILENKSETVNGEHKIEERGEVLENVSEAINGEKNSENLVFHDDIEGVNPISTNICKTLILEDPARSNFNDLSLDLHIEFNGTSVVNNQFEEGIEDSSSNVEPSPSDISSREGVDSTSTYIIREPFLKGPAKYDVSSLDLAPQSIGTSVINNDNGISSSNAQHPNSYEPSKEIESAETDVIDEDDLEITEFDVERVIKKQTTHDLYCPNCKSCITKRVILSKRKRRIRIPAEEVKRPKTDTAIGPDLVTVSDLLPEDDAQIPTIDEEERDKGPDIFRCLSCFSIFIPSGDGFKLFRLFGDKSGTENVQDEQASNVKKNWFSNIFKPNKQETVFEQASYSAIPLSDPAPQRGEPSNLQDTGPDGLQGTTGKTGIHEGGDKTQTFPNLKPSVNGVVKLDMKATQTAVATKFDVFNADQRMESKASQDEVHISRDSVMSTTLPMKTQVTNEYTEDVVSFPKQDGLKFLINPNKEFPTTENSEEGAKPNQLVQPGGADKDVVHPSEPSVSVVQASDVDGMLNISVSIPHEEQDVTATIVTTSLLENKNADSRSSDNGEIYPAEVPQQLVTTQTFDFHHDEPLRTGISSAVVDAPPGQVNDTTITIDTHPPETQISTAGGERSEVRDQRRIEVIKSIVYGGLAESLTSLSVVSSAAGGGAATLNVLAMGAANLIGGFFIIFHNLWDLRYDNVAEQLSNQITEQADRYNQLLGRRQNFALHAVVAIISYIIFGLVAPVAYGFSFRESDDKQLKLVVVAAASLLCILVLAVGKAYVKRPPKSYLKTVMTFMIVGILVSGVSYAAGGLVERLLEKLGLFEASSAAAPNLLVQEMGTVGSGWSSI